MKLFEVINFRAIELMFEIKFYCKPAVWSAVSYFIYLHHNLLISMTVLA